MPSLFDKINHLVKAQINDLTSPIDDRMSRSRKKALSRQDIRGGLETDVVVLRQRLEEALDYEGELAAKVDKIYGEIADLDAEADKAVSEGRETDARVAIGRIQGLQKELQMAEAQLKEHRFITQEFLSQLNTFEGVVDESRSRDNDSDTIIEDEPSLETLSTQIVQKLDDTRQKLSDLISSYYEQTGEQKPVERSTRPKVSKPPQPKKAAPKAPAKSSHPVNTRAVDKDLESRVSRLSKPDKEDK